MEWQGGLSDFLSVMLGSFNFSGLHYGANVAGLMWLITLLIGYNVFLAVKGRHEKSEALLKLTLMVGAFGLLYGVFLAVFDVGNPEIPIESKKFELLARVANSSLTLTYALAGAVVVKLIEFLKSGKSKELKPVVS